MATIVPGITTGLAMNKTIAPAALLCAVSCPSWAQEPAWHVLDGALHEGGAEHRELALAPLATIGGEDARAVKAAVDALRDKDPSCADPPRSPSER